MKILLIGEASFLHNTLKKGLLERGHRVITMSDGNGWHDAPRDIDLRRFALEGMQLYGLMQDYRDGQADLYGARVTPGGGVLDIGGLAFCTETNDQTEPVVSWDGSRHLLAWSDSRGQTTPASPRPRGHQR